MPLYLSIPMIPLGLAMAGFGFWAASRPKVALSLAGNVAAPAGVALALVGTVLVCIPDFFAG